MEDLNTREYLEKIKIQVFENLRQTAHAPSVQGHVEPRSIAEQLHLQNLANGEDVDENMDLAEKNGLQGLEDRHPDQRVVDREEFRDYSRGGMTSWIGRGMRTLLVWRMMITVWRQMGGGRWG